MQDDKGRMDTMRDMEKRGRPVTITEEREGCRRKEHVMAEFIRNQIEESKGYLHEVGNVEISDHV